MIWCKIIETSSGEYILTSDITVNPGENSVIVRMCKSYYDIYSSNKQELKFLFNLHTGNV